MSVTPPTAAQLQQLIVLEVGDAEDKRLARNIGLVWSIYAPVGASSQTLQYLYGRRHAILMVMGAVREQVDISAGGEVNVTHSQRIGNLERMLAATQAEIDALAGGGGAGAGAGGLLATDAATLELAPEADDYPAWWGNKNDPSADPSVEALDERAAEQQTAALAARLRR